MVQQEFHEITPVIEELAAKAQAADVIDSSLYAEYDVKRGLRDLNGVGVLAGLTHVSQVRATKVVDGVKVPDYGQLIYRGYDIKDLVHGILDSGRFGYEEVAYLLLFGDLPNEEELKTSLLNILKHPTILDHLPTDVMAVLDREYYTLNYEEYQVEKALTSWFDIINSITEDQIDDCKAIKLFIYEALEKSTLPRWIITAIKEQLKQNIKALRNPQPTPHTITNNFNAPISNFAQEQHVDHLTTK